VIDDDRVEPSNVSRIFGSRVEDARNRIPKVEVLRRLAEDIGVGTAIEAVQGSIVDAQVAAHLRDADVVFCCTDTHWSRCILNQFADQYLTPVIDMGNRIHAVNGRIQAADGRVYVVLPGGTCLWCCEAIRSDAVRTESLPDEERSRLEREGYVRGFEIGSPSVISLNAVVSGLAVTEFINLMTGFMGRETQPQLIYNMLGNSVKHGVYRPAGTCDCSTGRVRAKGDLDKLPCRTQNQVEDGCEVKAV
jgi:molybdopterin/thiamine biosynthesis adenylyltransferase